MKIANEKVSEVKESYQNDKLQLEKEGIKKNLLNTEKLVIKKSEQLKIVIIFSVIVFILVIILLKLFFNKRKSQKDLVVKNEEKDILIKEINHRVKNNMQMVSSLLALQEGKTLDLNSKKTLSSAAERINALSLAHQQMYHNDDYSNIRMKEYLELICNNLTKNSGVNYELNFEDKLFFDIEKGQAVGFIINELITNSLKHGWNETQDNKFIKIEIVGNSHSGVITYYDNGIGIIDGTRLEKSNSLGFSLVKSFVSRQLKGGIELKSNKGFTIIIRYNI